MAETSSPVSVRKGHFRIKVWNFFKGACCSIVLCSPPATQGSGFTVTLNHGKMYGPGSLGTHDLQEGVLLNFVVTAPLTGNIAFFNNGAKSPNTYAETLHTGPVDGRLSNGTLINENINAGFVIKVNEPATKLPVELLICSVSEEIVEPDAKGNLVFKLHAAFDSGFAEDVVELPVQFVTGMVEVPLSEKSKRGLPSGHDQAGPFPAGSIYIGRLGDEDQDGFLDGVFALAGNTPSELIIVEGDPVLIVRPFKSDIPISPQEAGFYELNGIVQNFPNPLHTSLDKANKDVSLGFLMDVKKRLDTARTNLNRVRKRDKRGNQSWVESARVSMDGAYTEIEQAITAVETDKFEWADEKVTTAFDLLESLHREIIRTRGRFI